MTSELENTARKLLDLINIDYTDLTPYQKDMFITIIEDAIMGSKIVEERYETGYDEGYNQGCVDEKAEREKLLVDEFDRGWEAGRVKGYEEGYSEARDKYE